MLVYCGSLKKWLAEWNINLPKIFVVTQERLVYACSHDYYKIHLLWSRFVVKKQTFSFLSEIIRKSPWHLVNTITAYTLHDVVRLVVCVNEAFPRLLSGSRWKVLTKHVLYQLHVGWKAEHTGSSSAVVSSILQNRREARKEHSGDIENGWNQEFCVLLTF